MVIPIVAAALPYRQRDGCYEILLVRSTSGRWIIPKGQSEAGEATFQAAQREAWEEAGVRGDIEELPYAAFDYHGSDKVQHVLVHPLLVRETLPTWPEQKTRPQMWVPATALPANVPPELAGIIADFAEEFCPTP